jgi:putative addiction module killer protein
MSHQYEVLQTEEYEDWFEEQPLKTRTIVAKRIKSIVAEGYFGDFKDVSKYDKGVTRNCVFELRWDDGKRVYYGRIGEICLLLLYGGNKNGQNHDIKEAKKIFIKYIEEERATKKGGKSKKI